MIVFQSWQEKALKWLKFLCSPGARLHRHKDPGCSWADFSRCEHHWERHSSLLPSGGASCCKRRPGGARLQTTDCCWCLSFFVPTHFILLKLVPNTVKRMTCFNFRCCDSYNLVGICKFVSAQHSLCTNVQQALCCHTTLKQMLKLWYNIHLKTVWYFWGCTQSAMHEMRLTLPASQFTLTCHNSI